jgi:beta-lactamase regulating signal transducer with metallopeptidase domain
VLWFNPLIWIVGLHVARYREFSCDESVLQRSRGGFLMSALAKLALHDDSRVLQSAATTLVSGRLERLLAAAPNAPKQASIVVAAAFAVLLCGGVLFTVAHTACCLMLVQ